MFGLESRRFEILINGLIGEGSKRVNAAFEIFRFGQTMMLENLGTDLVFDFFASGQTCLNCDSSIFKIGFDVQVSATYS